MKRKTNENNSIEKKIKLLHSNEMEDRWGRNIAYSFTRMSMIGISRSGPQKYFVLSTIRRPNKNNAVAENDFPNTSNTPAIIGGSPSVNVKPPITPKTVINRIGLSTIDFKASTISVFLLGRAWFNSFPFCVDVCAFST